MVKGGLIHLIVDQWEESIILDGLVQAGQWVESLLRQALSHIMKLIFICL